MLKTNVFIEDDGELDEVEPVGTMWVNLSSVVDFFPWKHTLPETQK